MREGIVGLESERRAERRLRLTFAVPGERLQSLIYRGRTLSAREALGAGLVDEVVAPDALPARAHEVVRQLALIPPPVYRLTKQSLRAEAMERIEHAGEPPDRAVLEVWSAADTHAQIREYPRRTLGK
jgi:enoyl-CoA hydratase/carnithine racemase